MPVPSISLFRLNYSTVLSMPWTDSLDLEQHTSYPFKYPYCILETTLFNNLGDSASSGHPLLPEKTDVPEVCVCIPTRSEEFEDASD